MIFGHVRDKFPRVTLSLPGRDGPLAVEFIVDTAFDGELALPSAVLARLDAVRSASRPVQLADGSFRSAPFHQVPIPWDEEERVVEVIEFNGRPLLGVDLLLEYFLGAAMTDGGEVQIEPL